LAHHLQAFQQNRIEQEWLAAFEVNRIDRRSFLNLVQQFAKLAESERTVPLRPAVQKAVMALAGASVGEQDVYSCQHNGASAGSKQRQVLLSLRPRDNGSTLSRVCL
jgi:hypothetical protein